MGLLCLPGPYKTFLFRVPYYDFLIEVLKQGRLSGFRVQGFKCFGFGMVRGFLEFRI